MNKIVAFFILLFAHNFCCAQQKIVFEKIDANQFVPFKKEYTLPKSVTCIFKDGTKQRVVLEKIKGDSLIFRKYYNQTQNYDCLFSSLKKIKIHKKGEEDLYALFTGFVLTSISFVTVAIITNHPPSDAGYPSLSYSIFFSVASVFPIIGTIITTAYFPRSYKPNNWELYAK